MDIITDYRARKLREDGASFRAIAHTAGISLTRAKLAYRHAPEGRMRREMRDEIRRAGGFKHWWDNR